MKNITTKSKNGLTKKLVIIAVIVSLLFIGAIFIFAGKHNTPSDNNKELTAQLGARNGTSTMPAFDQNFTTATSEKLIVGEVVAVFGPKDASGVVTADRIIIGMTQQEFEQQRGQFMRPDGENPNATSSDNGMAIRQGRRTGATSPDFQNLSPEQLQAMRAQRQQNRPAMARQMEITYGTIIQKDDTSITVTLKEGGSRYVLFSPTTKILEPKEVIK